MLKTILPPIVVDASNFTKQVNLSPNDLLVVECYECNHGMWKFHANNYVKGIYLVFCLQDVLTNSPLYNMLQQIIAKETY